MYRCEGIGRNESKKFSMNFIHILQDVGCPRSTKSHFYCCRIGLAFFFSLDQNTYIAMNICSYSLLSLDKSSTNINRHHKTFVVAVFSYFIYFFFVLLIFSAISLKMSLLIFLINGSRWIAFDVIEYAEYFVGVENKKRNFMMNSYWIFDDRKFYFWIRISNESFHAINKSVNLSMPLNIKDCDQCQNFSREKYSKYFP